MDRLATRARMSVPRALASEALRLRRSPLAAVHLVCAGAAGAACGAYFAFAPWDAALGADAYVQMLGAMMPLMVGIVCGLSVDEERRAGRLANLTGAPSRHIAILAKAAMLWLAGAAALALATAIFCAALALAGRLALGPAQIVLAWGGLCLGSAPLYLLELALAARLSRNAAIAVGSAGLVLAFFSVGGLAHGLMTGELTGIAGTGMLGAIPFAWPARLGSLGVEAGIAAAARDAALGAQICGAASALGCASLAVSGAGTAALALWFNRFEDRSTDV